MRDFLILLLIVVCAVPFIAAVAVLVVCLLINCVVDFLLFGHMPTPAGICDECGQPRIGAPRHRWQIVTYLRWLFQHQHSTHRRRLTA